MRRQGELKHAGEASSRHLDFFGPAASLTDWEKNRLQGECVRTFLDLSHVFLGFVLELITGFWNLHGIQSFPKCSLVVSNSLQ